MVYLSFFIALSALFEATGAVACSQTSFPTSNAALTTSGEVVSFSTVEGSLSLSTITCETTGTANEWVFAQVNLPYSTTTLNAANVCSASRSAAISNINSFGTFFYSYLGEF